MVAFISTIPHVHSLMMVVRKQFAIEIRVVLMSLLTALKEDMWLALQIVLSRTVIRPALINTFVSYLLLLELKNSPQQSF